MTNIKQILNKAMKAEEIKRANVHVASGRLSASSLGMPAQWQVLKYLGVPKKANDEYELLKFRRGRDVEDFIINTISGYIEYQTQVECEYRGCIGYLDLLIDSEAIEIKSTGGMAFKRVLKEGQAKKSHALQAAFYAMALNFDKFGICYVNADSYDTVQFEYTTNKFKDEIDDIISRFNNYINNKTIPKFIAPEKWMAAPTYQQYPVFADLDELGLAEIADFLYSSKEGK